MVPEGGSAAVALQTRLGLAQLGSTRLSLLLSPSTSLSSARQRLAKAFALRVADPVRSGPVAWRCAVLRCALRGEREAHGLARSGQVRPSGLAGPVPSPRVAAGAASRRPHPSPDRVRRILDSGGV